MFKKILLTIQILLSSLFSVVSIENNITTPIPRLMANERVTTFSPIPNTGYVSEIYFNDDLSSYDVRNALDNVTFIQTPFLQAPVYPLLVTEDGSLFVFAAKWPANETYPFNHYEINYSTDIVNQQYGRILFTNDELNSQATIYTTNLVIKSNVISSFNGIPVGTQNNLITSLTSLTSYISSNQWQAGYDEGYSTGWQNGYDEGYDEGYADTPGGDYEAGYEAGYDEGYDIGKQDGKNNTNPFGGFFEILESATASMHNFFSIEILPNLTLSTILGIFIALPLFIFFMKLISAK